MISTQTKLSHRIYTEEVTYRHTEIPTSALTQRVGRRMGSGAYSSQKGLARVLDNVMPGLCAEVPLSHPIMSLPYVRIVLYW